MPSKCLHLGSKASFFAMMSLGAAFLVTSFNVAQIAPTKTAWVYVALQSTKA